MVRLIGGPLSLKTISECYPCATFVGPVPRNDNFYKISSTKCSPYSKGSDPTAVSQTSSKIHAIKSSSGVTWKLERKGIASSRDVSVVGEWSHLVSDMVGAWIICMFRDDLTQFNDLLKNSDALPFVALYCEGWVGGREWAEAEL